MFQITPHLGIPDDEFQWSYVRSSGPGGQNVNKVASKAVLRWAVTLSPSLPEEVRQRFLVQQKTRVTTEGDLLLSSQRYRDQDRNRQDCLEKLRELLLLALIRPKPRRKTKPTRASRERRLEEKTRRAAGRVRRNVPHDE